jgi:hypothetical protein
MPRRKKSTVGGMLVHDPLDRPSAAATLRIAAEVAEEFANRAWRRADAHRGSYRVVAEDIAGGTFTTSGA